MLQSRLKSGAQEVAPKGFPGNGNFRMRRYPLQPWLTQPELRVASPQAGVGGSRGPSSPGVVAPWWQIPRHGLLDILVRQATEPGVDIRAPRLPALPTVVQRMAQNPAALSSRLLPPLFSAVPSTFRRPAPVHREDHRRGLAREAPNALGALLREFLPSRFREFLCHLLSASDEQQWKEQTSSELQHQVGLSEHSPGSPQCSNFSFLPDLGGQPPFFRKLPLSTESLKILLHQITDLGSLKKDCSHFSMVRKTNHRPHSAQTSRLKAVLTHSTSGEGSGLRKRCCPFRVRFADETLRDTALRYWERSCAIRQSVLDSGPAPQPVVSEQMFHSVGRWLESLPKAMCPGARQEKATTTSSSWSWDCPSLPTLEPQGHLPEKASKNSSLPRIPRVTIQRQLGDLTTHLDVHSILKQVGKLPRTWNQKLESFLPSLVLQCMLKRGRPKGYQLLLPSETLPRVQRAAEDSRPAASYNAARYPREGSVGLTLAPPDAAETSQPLAKRLETFLP
ncbi:PREDICTED: uncharacterized protein C9orf50 homolog [Chrysochloris asiatica]|uniref:Uncharacterized protein C9orf50 homolog n=1 Tax=Chrysochloris asiatica TaxID=185453 RepID=A0A9B0T451_CHRAS|nr:PREDICTED: uncharacterized protein C9orf50 homolog [Chrysochloris asiatica]